MPFQAVYRSSSPDLVIFSYVISRSGRGEIQRRVRLYRYQRAVAGEKQQRWDQLLKGFPHGFGLLPAGASV